MAIQKVMLLFYINLLPDGTSFINIRRVSAMLSKDDVIDFLVFVRQP